MNEAALEALPALPQVPALRGVAERLWDEPDVLALWLGGSFARGDADGFSDVDLRVAVRPEAAEAWRAPGLERLFGGACVGSRLLSFGGPGFLHHAALADGTIFD